MMTIKKSVPSLIIPIIINELGQANQAVIEKKLHPLPSLLWINVLKIENQ